MKWFIFPLALLLAVNVQAGNYKKPDIEAAKDFLKNNPIIEHPLDEMGLVNLWQRIHGVHNLINLWQNDQPAFQELGPENLSYWRMHIIHRIGSHMVNSKYTGNDEQVKALAALIHLHAYFADYYMSDEIKYRHYADVANYAEVNGSYLANMIEEKYGKGVKP